MPVLNAVRISLLLAAGAFAASGGGALMAVFAHPDDETTVGALLARYARLGHPVYLVTMTSGQRGVNPNTTLKAGDELGAAREEELRCAAAKLAIRPPELLRYMDQGISAPAVMDEIAGKLRDLIERYRIDILVTWGPEGVTGHQDHRAAGNIATQVFQERSKLRYKPRKLYYVAWPESRLAHAGAPFSDPGFARGVADELVTAEVDCRSDAEAAWKAIQCHKTQWDAARMNDFREFNVKTLDGRVFLRDAFAGRAAESKPEADIFAGLAAATAAR